MVLYRVFLRTLSRLILYIMFDNWLTCVLKRKINKENWNLLVEIKASTHIFQWACVIGSVYPLPVVCHSEMHAFKFVDQRYTITENKCEVAWLPHDLAIHFLCDSVYFIFGRLNWVPRMLFKRDSRCVQVLYDTYKNLKMVLYILFAWLQCMWWIYAGLLSLLHIALWYISSL